MNFTVNDVAQFQAQKEFIDTAIIPLVQLNLSDTGMKQSSSAVEYLMSLTNFIEQQFRGRLMLYPPFSYTEATKSEALPLQLQEELVQAGFKTVLFVTYDHGWTTKEGLNVIWMPPIPLESMDKTMKQRILEDQLKQILPILMKAWTSQV